MVCMLQMLTHPHVCCCQLCQLSYKYKVKMIPEFLTVAMAIKVPCFFKSFVELDDPMSAYFRYPRGSVFSLIQTLSSPK